MTLKRAFDIIFSSVGLMTTMPITLAAIFSVAAIERRFPLHTQRRPGLGKEPFTIPKIETMSRVIDENGKLLPDEQRVSCLGRIFRKTGIDELPQLISVINGDMSMIGPRPVPMHSPLADDEKRHRVKPGFLSPPELAGKNKLSTQVRLELEHKYVDTQSLANDIRVIFSMPKSLVEKMNSPHFREDAQLSFAPDVE